MGDLSKNFSEWEFICNCGCGTFKKNDELISALQRLRNLIDFPLLITSGTRCRLNNIKAGGFKKSLHLSGKAVDCTSVNIPLLKLYSYVLKIPEFVSGGIGVYPPYIDPKTKRQRDNFLHLDLGTQRRWGRIRGLYCGVIEAIEELKKQEANDVNAYLNKSNESNTTDTGTSG
jgi:hypothetical protein